MDPNVNGTWYVLIILTWLIDVCDQYKLSHTIFQTIRPLPSPLHAPLTPSTFPWSSVVGADENPGRAFKPPGCFCSV
jgi:hypothetical protein